MRWSDTFSAMRYMHIRNNATKYSQKHTCSFKTWKLNVFAPPRNIGIYFPSVFCRPAKNIPTIFREQKKSSRLLIATGFRISLKLQTQAAHCLKHICCQCIKKLNFWYIVFSKRVKFVFTARAGPYGHLSLPLQARCDEGLSQCPGSALRHSGHSEEPNIETLPSTHHPESSFYIRTDAPRVVLFPRTHTSRNSAGLHPFSF